MGLYVDIKKHLNDFTLDIQFDLSQGKMALLGASGSGKSMTLKCLAGIEKPDSGQIILDGEVLFDSQRAINLTPQQRKTGYLFQNYALFPHLTTAENIAIAIKASKQEKIRKVQEKITLFRLAGLENRYPAQLSGGQQQRVALARIFASEPRMLMLDEPFSALDNTLKWQLEQEFKQLLSLYQGVTLFVSHQRDEVYRLCDDVAVLNQGKLDIYGEKWQIFHQPQYLSAAILTGCKNYSRIKKIDQHQFEALDWHLTMSTCDTIADQVQFVGIRPENIIMVPRGHPHAVVCQNYTIVQDTTTTMVLINELNGQPLTTPLIWEVAKPYWQPIDQDQPLYLMLPKESLLLLRC